MDIEEWLNDFERGWKQKNIELVLNLFTDNVEYYETPFEKFKDKEELEEEWKTIRDQQNIQIETEVFSKYRDKFTVKWRLSYSKDGKENNLRGIYLIKLNTENKCYEFWQYPVSSE